MHGGTELVILGVMLKFTKLDTPQQLGAQPPRGCDLSVFLLGLGVKAALSCLQQISVFLPFFPSCFLPICD